MIERLSARRGDEKGFTLVELLVVIVILGVLASIVVFAVGGITNNSSKNACSTDKATVSAAEEAYYAQNSTYAPMATLVSANLLHSASTLVTVSLTGTAPTFTAYSIAPATAGAACP
jgi:general secretion pathway protein G